MKKNATDTSKEQQRKASYVATSAAFAVLLSVAVYVGFRSFFKTELGPVQAMVWAAVVNLMVMAALPSPKHRKLSPVRLANKTGETVALETMLMLAGGMTLVRAALMYGQPACLVGLAIITFAVFWALSSRLDEWVGTPWLAFVGAIELVAIYNLSLLTR
ncbi:MAG: hypothetical protein PHT12_00535 [Patescibacteria group bacterium]|nr:hypothetical protein [Patescibacteria group bacterium]